MALKVAELYEDLVVRDNTAGALNTAERNMGRVGDRVTALKGLMANIGIGALGAQLTRVSTEFNAGMANVASLIPGNSARVKELAGEVQSLRVQLGLTGQDATQGLYQSISAFGDGADTMTRLTINAKAAKAGVASLTDAINLTSAVTKAYGDTSTKAVQSTADLALMTVRLGQTTFPELAASIGRVTPITKQLGVSQQELFATMATATGVTGGAAEVSTQLRGVLQSLMAPTDTMSKLMQSLGYQNGQAMIKGLGLQGTIKAILDAANASGQPLQSYISQIEGQTLALAIGGPQASDYAAKLGQMQKAAGATDAAFKEQTSGINAQGFALEKLKQAWAVAQEKVGMIGPFLTAGASIAQLVSTIRMAMIPARVADTAALIAETAAQNGLNAAQAAGALTGGAAVGRGAGNILAQSGNYLTGAGIGARALGYGATALDAIGGTVGVGGGLAGAGVAGLYGVAAAGIGAVGYETYGIIKYNRDAAREQKAYEDSLKDPNTGLEAQAKRHADARKRYLARQEAKKRGLAAVTEAAPSIAAAGAGGVLPPVAAPVLPAVTPPAIPTADAFAMMQAGMGMFGGGVPGASVGGTITLRIDQGNLLAEMDSRAARVVRVENAAAARLAAAGG